MNAVTLKTIYPLPRIDEALARLEGSKYFSSVDLQSGYWQLAVRAEDQEKTAFTTADGHYQFRAMPFGLSGAAHTFQRAMDTILANLKWTTCLVYLDDIVIYGRDLEEHNARLRAVLQCRWYEAGWYEDKVIEVSFCSTFIAHLGTRGVEKRNRY